MSAPLRPTVADPPEICRYCGGTIGKVVKRRVHVADDGTFLYSVHPATPREWTDPPLAVPNHRIGL